MQQTRVKRLKTSSTCLALRAAKPSFQQELSPSTSAAGRALCPNSNHFCIMQMTPTPEKLHGICPSIQQGLRFEYMHFSPLTISLHNSERRSISYALRWCSHCCAEGIERALTQSIYTAPPLKSRLLSVVRNEIIQMHREFQLKKLSSTDGAMVCKKQRPCHSI